MASKRTAPLYYLVNPAYNTIKEQNGRTIYKQFQIGVLLKEQVQVTYPVWLDFLCHLHHGHVKEHHITMLWQLILSNLHCLPTDFSSVPWNDASLVTPRHVVHSCWNAAMVCTHCKATHSTLYVCPEYDTINKCGLTLVAQYAVAAQQEHKQKGQGTRNGLPDQIELALGMKVMVTTNISTDLTAVCK